MSKRLGGIKGCIVVRSDGPICVDYIITTLFNVYLTVFALFGVPAWRLMLVYPSTVQRWASLRHYTVDPMLMLLPSGNLFN